MKRIWQKFLREHEIYSTFSKCNFFSLQIHYLGHIVLREGVIVDPEKVKAIMEWLMPQNVVEFISFMGLVGHYMIFIKNFSKIGFPSISMQNKGKGFELMCDCTTRFDQFKQPLTKSQILRITYLEKYFNVCTDACKEGLGGVLMYASQMVCYESQNLNQHEQNYATHDQEVSTIIHVMKMWRHYLLGRKFSLITSHAGLKYLFAQPNLN